jgi:glycosyltransferase involved in cell wall biosynthesis
LEPFVSIVIPAYQTESYINKCLDSIINQTYSNFEVIVINDGSTDGTAELVKQYIELDHRFKLMEQKNLGPAAARNRGLEETSGDYLLFIDSDDYIHPKLLEHNVTTITEYNADVVIPTYVYYVDEFARKKQLVKLFDHKHFNKFFFGRDVSNYVIEVLFGQGRNWAVTKGALYRRCLVKNNSIVFPELKIQEDLVFNLRYFQYVNIAVMSYESYYYYLVRGGSITKSYNPSLLPNALFIDEEASNRLTFGNIEHEKIRSACDSLLCRNVIFYLLQEMAVDVNSDINDFVTLIGNLFKNERITAAFKNSIFPIPYWSSKIKVYFITIVRYLLHKKYIYIAAITLMLASKWYAKSFKSKS